MNRMRRRTIITLSSFVIAILLLAGLMWPVPIEGEPKTLPLQNNDAAQPDQNDTDPAEVPYILTYTHNRTYSNGSVHFPIQQEGKNAPFADSITYVPIYTKVFRFYAVDEEMINPHADEITYWIEGPDEPFTYTPASRKVTVSSDDDEPKTILVQSHYPPYYIVNATDEHDAVNKTREQSGWYEEVVMTVFVDIHGDGLFNKDRYVTVEFETDTDFYTIQNVTKL